jgi:hypothetical protein
VINNSQSSNRMLLTDLITLNYLLFSNEYLVFIIYYKILYYLVLYLLRYVGLTILTILQDLLIIYLFYVYT